MRTAWGTDHWAIHYAAYQVDTHPKYEGAVKLLDKVYQRIIYIGDILYFMFMAAVTWIVCRHFMQTRRPLGGFVGLNCALITIGTWLMLLFVESDPRYHLPGLLALIVIAALWFEENKTLGMARSGSLDAAGNKLERIML